MMKEMVQLLRIVAEHNPHVWEIIGPHVPKDHDTVASSQDPIPPAARELQLAVQETVRTISEAAIAARALGQGDLALQMLRDVSDDWCGTGWPGKWPRPNPRAESYLTMSRTGLAQSQAQAALTFAHYAVSIRDDEMSVTFAKIADRLCDAALASAQSSANL
jgi:hypothetical protein